MAKSAGKLVSALILFGTTAVLGIGSVVLRDDHALWDPLLRVHDALLLASGRDTIGEIYVTPERLLRKREQFPEHAAESAAEAVSRYEKTCNAPVYLLAVPTSAGMYADAIPAAAPMASESEFLTELRENLSDDVSWIGTESWLAAEREHEIYCRTSPLWTSYGAFCVYRAAVRRLGFTAHGYDSLAITHYTANYFGELAQEIRYYDVQPDLIDMFELMQPDPTLRVSEILGDGSTVSCGKSCYAPEEAQKSGDAEDVYLLHRHPILRTQSLSGSKRLLLLTDDYGAVMLPLLTSHYQTVTAVNLPRAKGADWKRLTDSGCDHVLILLGVDTLAEGISLN